MCGCDLAEPSTSAGRVGSDAEPSTSAGRVGSDEEPESSDERQWMQLSPESESQSTSSGTGVEQLDASKIKVVQTTPAKLTKSALKKHDQETSSSTVEIHKRVRFQHYYSPGGSSVKATVYAIVNQWWHTLSCTCSYLICFMIGFILFFGLGAYCIYIEATGEGTVYHRTCMAVCILFCIGMCLCFRHHYRRHFTQREFRPQERSVQSLPPFARLDRPSSTWSLAELPSSYSLSSYSQPRTSTAWTAGLLEESPASTSRQGMSTRNASEDTELTSLSPTPRAILQHYRESTGLNRYSIMTRSRSRAATVLDTSLTEGPSVPTTSRSHAEGSVGVRIPRSSSSPETFSSVCPDSRDSPSVITRSRSAQEQMEQMAGITPSVHSPQGVQPGVVTRSRAAAADLRTQLLTLPPGRVRKPSKKKQ